MVLKQTLNKEDSSYVNKKMQKNIHNKLKKSDDLVR